MDRAFEAGSGTAFDFDAENIESLKRYSAAITTPRPSTTMSEEEVPIASRERRRRVQGREKGRNGLRTRESLKIPGRLSRPAYKAFSHAVPVRRVETCRKVRKV